MIRRSFDKKLLHRMTESVRDMMSEEAQEKWWNSSGCLMFTEGNNVGLATLEYPGVYSIHWYFKCRGREAINLAKRMVRNLFDNYGAEAIRGIVRVDLKASRWGARQVGMKSLGIETFANGEDNEIFCMTKDNFNG